MVSAKTKLTSGDGSKNRLGKKVTNPTNLEKTGQNGQQLNRLEPKRDGIKIKSYSE